MKRKENDSRKRTDGEPGWSGEGIGPMTFLSNVMTRYHVSRSTHPRFVDGLSCNDRTGDETRDAINAKYAMEMLALRRKHVYQAVEEGCLTAETLLDCRVAEVCAALAEDDGTRAVDGCYGAIVVLMRMIDVIEGRQSLGTVRKDKRHN